VWCGDGIVVWDWDLGIGFVGLGVGDMGTMEGNMAGSVMDIGGRQKVEDLGVGNSLGGCAERLYGLFGAWEEEGTVEVEMAEVVILVWAFGRTV
jgi:hypothetical protein